MTGGDLLVRWAQLAPNDPKSGGLPLTADDVADLTGMGVNKTRQTLGLLVAGGVLASRNIEGNVAVWYDPHAMKEAA